jgi:ribonuclease HI
VVPKPNKPDYASLSAYRPIQLTECLGKILDKIVAKRIQFDVAYFELVPTTQFGGRILSSTIDAGLSLVQDIHEAWKQRKKASAIFFDIKGFFNAVQHEHLSQKLKKLGFDRKMVSLIESFLTNRTTNIEFDNFKSDPIPISNGIPQGSPLSPILAIIYSAELQELRSLILRRIISFAYIDDRALLTSSKTLEKNMEKLKPAFEIVSNWLRSNGLEVQPNKIELMHFTRGPDPNSPPLRLPNQTPITAPKTLRWLGFYLDRHLHFTHHTRIMAARATATIRAMKILGNTVRGMSHEQLRQLTLSTIIPTLTYGCQLWWGGRFSKTNTNRLQTSLNLALRAICRAFRSTPIYALQHIAHIPPISLTIRKICYSSSIRLHRLLPNSAVIRRIPKPSHRIALNHRNGNSRVQLRDPPQRQSPLQRIASLTNASKQPSLNPISRPPWEEPFSNHPRVQTILNPTKDQYEKYNEEMRKRLSRLLEDPTTLVVGTDGSRKVVDPRVQERQTAPLRQPVPPGSPRIRDALFGLDRPRIKGPKKTGAGVHAKHGNEIAFELKYGLGHKTNVYDGESLALAIGMARANLYANEHEEIKQIIFLSDSVSALTNITNDRAHPSQTISKMFQKHAETFLEKNPDHRITLQWIQGHKGHEINERADRLARSGRKLPQEIIPESLSYHAEKKTKTVLKEWRKEWYKMDRTSTFRKNTFLEPTIKPNKVFVQLRNQPELFGRLTQTRTMHGYNAPYFERLNIPYNPDCECGERLPLDPSRMQEHVLHSCYTHREHRHILSAAHRDHSPAILLGSIKGLLATAKYLKMTGAFSHPDRPSGREKTPDLPGLDLSDLSQNPYNYEPP